METELFAHPHTISIPYFLVNQEYLKVKNYFLSQLKEFRIRKSKNSTINKKEMAGKRRNLICLQIKVFYLENHIFRIASKPLIERLKIIPSQQRDSNLRRICAMLSHDFGRFVNAQVQIEELEIRCWKLRPKSGAKIC